MKFMKLVSVVVLSMFACSTYANSCAGQINSISGLSDVVKQKMISDCETQKLADISAKEKATSNTGDVMVDNADKWADVAIKFIGSISLVAKELNQSVNEFLPTPAGILAATLIVWKVMGEDILGIIGCIGGILFGVLVLCLTRSYCKKLLISTYEKKTVKGLFGREKVIDIPVYCSPNALSNKTINFNDTSDKEYYRIISMVGSFFGLLIIGVSIIILAV